MPAIDFSDESVIREELRKLVSREMATVFDDLNRTESQLEGAAAGLDGSLREGLDAALVKLRQGKLEAIQLFKGMHDFLA